MKRALISRVESGRICDIKNQGDEFEVTPDFFWMSVPDDTTTADSINMDDGTVVKFDPLLQPGFAENAYKVARAIAYKSVGEQLDMIYKEVALNGSLNADGAWATHIANVKSAIPKDDPAAVLAWNQQHFAALVEQQKLIDNSTQPQ